MKELTDFYKEINKALGKAAKSKGYDDQLSAFVSSNFGDGQALGEIVYKVVRYNQKKNPEDLVKAAAWAFILWRRHESCTKKSKV